MKGKAIFFLAIIVPLIFSCRNTSRNSAKVINPGIDSSSSISPENSTSSIVEEISRNFFSPVEMANLFQEMKVPFASEYLASPLMADNQVTPFGKALALGFLGADLGYLNIYQKTGSSIDLLSSIKKLADGLNVGQYFDFENIKRLSLSNTNLDSLLFLSLESFTRIDRYFRENGREQLSSLMLVGAWIEAQYFATQIIKKYPDLRIRDRIGEQGYFLNDLIKIISPYCLIDSNFARLCNSLNLIREQYKDVKVSYTQGAPLSAAKDGGLVIIQTDSSNVEMTDSQLKGIVEIIGSVRNQLILNN